MPSNQTVVVGGTARFTCTILSDMQPHLQWLKHYQVNGSWTNDKDVPYIQVIKVGDFYLCGLKLCSKYHADVLTASHFQISPL